MAQKPVLRGEVGCVCVAREVSVERGSMGERGCAPSAPTTPNTKGKRLGQRACIGRVAQGQRGGGMRVLGVFENWAGKRVCLKRPSAILTPPEETEHGTRPGGRGPGGVPGGVGSKNRGGHVRVYRGGSIPYSEVVCLSVCLSVPSHS